MCILCVVQKWSRRVATMLPWLVIPLIGLWALSQLLPPAFRFEITSPRLACVLVLLVTLFWYEILMPQLSAWRLRRNARLRERNRVEAIEMQKLRKTALRRCRNCLTPYGDQNPGGGRFMCSYCGHISKRPVLDLPSSSGLGLSNSGILKDLVERSGKMFNGKMWADSGWVCGQDWLENSNWAGGSFAGKSTYWEKNRGGFFIVEDHCLAEKSYSCVVLFSFKMLMAFFLSIRWLWKKITRVSSSEDYASLDAEHRGMLSNRGENGVNFHESKGEKARRKAEEKRQARLERELLEEEERKQREEVARLVEERRRLRDEKMEAEKDRRKGSATAREKDNKKEAERKRLDRKKEKEKGFSKGNSDAEELEKRIRKENDRMQDFDRTSETDRPEHRKSGVESAKALTMDTGHCFKGAAVNDSGKGIAGTRYLDRMKGTILSPSRAFTSGSFFRKGASTATSSRENKPNGFVDHLQNSVKGREFSQPEHVYEKSNINGDGRNISLPVFVEPHPTTIPKKSWHHLFSCSSAASPQTNSNVISRPNGKTQSEVQSPLVSGHSSSMQLYDNPINFGLPSPFILPTSPYVPMSNSTVLPVAYEAMVPPILDTSCEFLPEESDIFEDPCYVPDPVSLLGPVSESLDHFQFDLCAGLTDVGLEHPRALKNIPLSSEVNKPSPIGSPMSRLRVSNGRHSSSNQFSGTSKVHGGHPPNEEGTWQMWNSCPLGQDGLGLIGGPGSWLLCPELNRSNKEELHPLVHKTMSSLFTKEDKAISSTPTQNFFLGDCQNGGIFGTTVPSSGDDPWLPKKLFRPVSQSEDHFPVIPSEETSQFSHQNKRIYGIPGGSESNQFSPSSSWAKKEWSVQGSEEDNRNATISNAHIGGLYSTPDVRSPWS